VGQTKGLDIEKQKNEQRDMIQEFENNKEKLFNTREEKEDLEGRIQVMCDKIRVDKQ
jgi:chromosome segregation ATPase